MRVNQCTTCASDLGGTACRTCTKFRQICFDQNRKLFDEIFVVYSIVVCLVYDIPVPAYFLTVFGQQMIEIPGSSYDTNLIFNSSNYRIIYSPDMA